MKAEEEQQRQKEMDDTFHQEADQQVVVIQVQRKNWLRKVNLVMGIKRFDHETKVKVRSERQNLQAASQLYTKQVGTGEINQIIESLLKVNV